MHHYQSLPLSALSSDLHKQIFDFALLMTELRSFHYANNRNRLEGPDRLYNQLKLYAQVHAKIYDRPEVTDADFTACKLLAYNTVSEWELGMFRAINDSAKKNMKAGRKDSFNRMLYNGVKCNIIYLDDQAEWIPADNHHKDKTEGHYQALYKFTAAYTTIINDMIQTLNPDCYTPEYDTEVTANIPKTTVVVDENDPEPSE
jgi:hypothetical protein